MQDSSSSNAGSPRRRFLVGGLLALFGGVIGKKALAEEPSELVTEGEVLRTNIYKGRPPLEPLDTMVRMERSDNNSTGHFGTHEILSLVHEEKGNRSYPWTIYAHLTTHHVEGDACVLCSRLTKNGAGWSSGLHSEVFSNARAVALGVNVEMTNNYAGPDPTTVIGLNIQALGPYDCQYGIQVHGDRGAFEKAVGLNGRGKIGLDIPGKYEQGIHLHGNTIRVDEGTPIELDGEGKVRIRYKAGRIEFLNGDRCVGHIDVSGEDHEM